ncbi:MAG: hypothetical protein LBB74_05935 [Chitinispirillales bacterium]|nr:hypothetical protein [Chitinispirillales bacterium]
MFAKDIFHGLQRKGGAWRVRRILAALALCYGAAAGAEPVDWVTKADVSWYTDNPLAAEFIITTAGQLAGLAKLVNGGNTFDGEVVKLGADIALNDTSEWLNWKISAPRYSWTPIGYKGGQWEAERPFAGTFDGGGFIIYGLFCGSGATGGLFGYVNPIGTIEGLGVQASYCAGSSYIGGLVIKNRGRIINCRVTGYFSSGWSSVGGLVSENGGQIIRCCFSGNISGGLVSAGGLVGENYRGGEIKDCYAAGSFLQSGGNRAGGLVGWNNGGSITNCYAVGRVSGMSYGDAGGLVGANDVVDGKGGDVNSSYYNRETGGLSDVGKGSPKTTAEMKLQDTYAGWDFNEIWVMDGQNSGYPYFRRREINEKH